MTAKGFSDGAKEQRLGNIPRKRSWMATNIITGRFYEIFRRRGLTVIGVDRWNETSSLCDGQEMSSNTSYDEWCERKADDDGWQSLAPIKLQLSQFKGKS